MVAQRGVQRFVSFIRVVLLLSVTVQMAVSGAAAASLDSVLSSSAVDRSQPANAQPQIIPPRLDLVGQYGGTLTALAVSGELAFAGVGPRMKIVDTSDPANLRMLGETGVLPAMLVDLAVSGRYVYAAMRDDGIRVFDVVDPTAPVEVGSFSQTNLKIRALAIEGDYIYLTHDAGLTILDVSDPTAPAALSTVALPALDGGGKLVVVAQIVYVAAYRAGVRIIDASYPYAPVEVGFLQTNAPVQDLAVAAPYLYAATNNALVIVNAADLTAPVQLSSYPIANPPESMPFRIAARGGSVYITARYGFQVFDLVNPAAPAPVGSVELFQDPFDLVVDDRYIYAAGKNCLQAFVPTQPVSLPAVGFADLTTPLAPPIEIGRLIFSQGNVTDITVAGDFVYTVDDTSFLSIVDVTDPTTPTEVGRVDRLYPNPYHENDVEVAKGYAYVVDNGLLHIFNITDPVQPVGITQPLTISYVTDVAIADDYAYAAGDFFDMVRVVGLYSIDIRDPERPELVDDIYLPWAADEFVSRTVALSGHYAYVGGAFYHWRTRLSGNLAVVDIANPMQLAMTGFTYLGATWCVAVDGSYVYATASRDYYEHYERLFTVDVSNPALPTPAAWADVSYAYRSNLVVSQQRAYFTSLSGLTIFDIRRPLRPVRLFTDPLIGWPTSTAVDGGYVYVATTAAGFFIFRYIEPLELPQSWLPVMMRP